VYVDDGRDSVNRIREANLENHLGTGRAETSAAKTAPRAAGQDNATPGAQPTGASTQPPLPRFDFGSAEDFQLTQALNQLKGLPVIASTKAVSAQAKPQ